MSPLREGILAPRGGEDVNTAPAAHHQPLGKLVRHLLGYRLARVGSIRPLQALTSKVHLHPWSGGAAQSGFHPFQHLIRPGRATMSRLREGIPAPRGGEEVKVCYP